MEFNRPIKHRETWVAWMAATVFFLGWTLYGTMPLPLHLFDSTYYAYGDNLLCAYILRWNLHQLPINPLGLFDATFYYPLSNTLALSENLLGLSLLFWPIDLIFDDTLLLANLVILVSFFSLALLAFGLFRHWTGSWTLGVLAGMWIAFAPPRYTQFGHLQLLNYHPMLLGFYFADEWLRGQRRRHAVGLFLTIYAQFLFGIYLFVFYLVLLSSLVPILVLIRRRQIDWARLLRQGLVGGLLLAIAIYPIYKPYRDLKVEHGIMVKPEDIVQTGADPVDYLAVSSLNKLWGFTTWRFENKISPYPWENGIGLHYSLYAMLVLSIPLAGWLIRRRIARRFPLPSHAGLFAGLWATALLMFLLAFGPRVYFRGQAYESIPTLWSFYSRFFPGFEGLRVPPRLIFPLGLCLATLALLPCAWLRQELGRRGRMVMQACLVMLVGFVLWESRVMPLPLKITPRKSEIPRVYAALREQPRAPLFIWPAGFSEELSYLYLYFNSYHWYPMVNGTSGHLPHEQGNRLNRLIEHFPSAGELRYLRRKGINYVLYHSGYEKEPARREADTQALLALEQEGKLDRLYADDQDYLWRIADARPFEKNE